MASRLAVELTMRAAARALGWVHGSQQDEAVWTAAVAAWGLMQGVTRGRGMPVDLLPSSDPPTAEELAAIQAAATPRPDLAAVALAVTLRLAPNPAQRRSESTSTDGGTSRRVEGAFEGFTLAEMLVLNRYRRRVR